MSWIATAYAMGANNQAAAGQEGSLLTGLAPFAIIFIVFYFLLIRPQQKKAKAHKEMLAALKKGDAVITAGGLYGRIVETDADTVLIDLGETRVTIARGYISGVPGSNAGVPPAKKDKKERPKAAKVIENPSENAGDKAAGKIIDVADTTPPAEK